MRAALSTSRGTKCFTAYYVLLSVEMGLLLLAAAAHAMVLMRARARWQRAQHGLQLAGVVAEEVGAPAAAAAMEECAAPAAAKGQAAKSEGGSKHAEAEAGAAAPAAAAAQAAAAPAAGAATEPAVGAAAAAAAADTEAAAPAAAPPKRVTPDSRRFGARTVLAVQAITLVGGAISTVIGLGGGERVGGARGVSG